MANTILFIKKSLRSLKYSKSKSIPILIIIAVGGMTSIPFFSFQTAMNQSINSSWNDLAYQDALLTVVPSSYQLLLNNLTATMRNTGIYPKYEFRSFFPAEVNKFNSSQPINSNIIAVNTSRDHQTQVDKLYIDSGVSLQNSSQYHAVLVDSSQAQKYNWDSIETNLSVTSNFGKFSVMTVGYADSPEYLLKPTPDAELLGSFVGPILWMRLNDLISIENQSSILNQIALKFNSPQNETAVFLNAFTKEFGQKNIINIVGQDQSVLTFRNIITPIGTGLGFIFIVLSSFVLYIILSRIIEEDKTLLGIFKALGMNTKELVINIISFGIILAFIGGFIGILGGLLIGVWAGNVVDIYFKKLPSVGIPFDPLPAFYYLLATLIVAIVSSLLVSIKTLKISPQDAIRINNNLEPGKVTYFERLIQRFIKLPPLAKFSIRSVFMRKKKTLLTSFGVLLSIAVIFAGLSFNFSYNNAINHQFTYNETWDLQVFFTHPIPANNVSSDLNISNLCLNNCTEGFFIASGKIINFPEDTLNIVGLQPSSIMHRFDNVRTLKNGSLYISADIANKYQMHTNSNITMLIQSNTTLTLNIGAILYDGGTNEIYTTIYTARQIAGESSNLVNGVFIKSSNESKIMKLLTSNPLVVKILNKTDIEKSFQLNQIDNALTLMIVFSGSIIGLVIVITVITITIAERRADFINFRAIGISNKEIFRTILLEIFIAGILGLVLGLILGIEIFSLLAQWIAQKGFPILIDWNFIALFGSILLTLLGLTISAFISLRSLFNTNIGSFTHEQMFG